jgi:hypothetical protein
MIRYSIHTYIFSTTARKLLVSSLYQSESVGMVRHKNFPPASQVHFISYMINSEYILSVRRKVIDGSFTHVMLDINIYNKITIPAWFIPRNFSTRNRNRIERGMDDSSYRLIFYLDKKDEIFHYIAQKRILKLV